MLTTKSAAAILGLSEQRIRQLLKVERIQGAQRLGRDWVIPDPPVVLPAKRKGTK